MKKTMLFRLTASLALCAASSAAMAAPTIHSTADPSHWQVEINNSGVSTTAVSVAEQPTVWATNVEWISNIPSATNNDNPTSFHFYQTFDLTGYDPTTAQLSFEVAWDNLFNGFSLNGGQLTNPLSNTNPPFGFVPFSVSSGFVDGLNTIHFYVEGDGVTDGLAFNVLSFTATALPIPEPGIGALLLGGIGIMGMIARRRRTARASGVVRVRL
ncbi:MAG: PEP-CTERM sorting domain-containing protein [Azoarcus sp.]|jgi:hypothetical protein|nr:PEP-CTERM sorting domain-containing protein [Azoarcus sp.]